MQIQTVLCPIDFSDVAAREIDVAVEVCRTFGARLVLHHNVTEVGPGFARAWDWDAAHHGSQVSVPAAERRLRDILKTVGGGVAVEAVVTVGPLAATVLSLAQQLPADLVVLGSHGWSTPDHASVTERVIERVAYPVLTVHEGGDRPAFRLHALADDQPPRVLVPTDFSPGSAAAVAYAFALGRTLPLRLDLLHVVANASRVGPATGRLEALVPADAHSPVEVHVRVGAHGEEILTHIRETTPAFAILGAHARSLVRRLLTRDTARELVHRAECPVWLVPDRPAGHAR